MWLSLLVYGQIWLNLLKDDCHFFNKRANRKKEKLPTGSFAILDAMVNYIDVMKKLELKKMKLKKFITSQMLQSEKNGRQLYLVVLFAKD
jgi:hypothetical protein